MDREQFVQTARTSHPGPYMTGLDQTFAAGETGIESDAVDTVA